MASLRNAPSREGRIHVNIGDCHDEITHHPERKRYSQEDRQRGNLTRAIVAASENIDRLLTAVRQS
jgi:hypothetical protein